VRIVADGTEPARRLVEQRRFQQLVVIRLVVVGVLVKFVKFVKFVEFVELVELVVDVIDVVDVVVIELVVVGIVLELRRRIVEQFVRVRWFVVVEPQPAGGRASRCRRRGVARAAGLSRGYRAAISIEAVVSARRP
jgi:hypothetical protein